MKKLQAKGSSKKQKVNSSTVVVSNLKTEIDYEKFAKRMSIVLSLLAN